jgi:hypothetical protein
VNVARSHRFSRTATAARQPGHANTLVDPQTADIGTDAGDPPDNLVARCQWQPVRRQFPIDDVQACAAHAAGGHADQGFIRAGCGAGSSAARKGAPGRSSTIANIGIPSAAAPPQALTSSVWPKPLV